MKRIAAKMNGENIPDGEHSKMEVTDITEYLGDYEQMNFITVDRKRKTLCADINSLRDGTNKNIPTS